MTSKPHLKRFRWFRKPFYSRWLPGVWRGLGFSDCHGPFKQWCIPFLYSEAYLFSLSKFAIPFENLEVLCLLAGFYCFILNLLKNDFMTLTVDRWSKIDNLLNTKKLGFKQLILLSGFELLLLFSLKNPQKKKRLLLRDPEENEETKRRPGFSDFSKLRRC